LRFYADVDVTVVVRWGLFFYVSTLLEILHSTRHCYGICGDMIDVSTLLEILPRPSKRPVAAPSSVV